MRALNKFLFLILIVSSAACSSMPSKLDPEDRLKIQVVFTVSDDRKVPAMVSGYAGSSAGTSANTPTSSQAVIAGILKHHKLRKVGEKQVSALQLTAVIAEIKDDRDLQDVVNKLDRDPRIESVQKVSRYDLLTYNDPYAQFQGAVGGEGFALAHTLATGKDVVVGLIDTGVDRSHPELVGNIIFAKNFVEHDQLNFDLDEHGTAVAGVIAAAANNEQGIVGVAPDVKIMVFKSCWQDTETRQATCDSYSIVKALIEVLKQQPDILNLSLAGPRDALIERLLVKASEQGIIIIAAIDSQDLSNSFPASMEEVIAVGTSFFEGPLPFNTVLAPGVDVLTTVPGATYAFRSGSSLASAYVAGAAALLKERQPTISGQQFQKILATSSRFNFENRPIVNVCEVVSWQEDGEFCPVPGLLYSRHDHRTAR
jgi:subtilisin family serine protease